jgi:hypothetical protein
MVQLQYDHAIRLRSDLQSIELCDKVSLERQIVELTQYHDTVDSIPRVVKAIASDSYCESFEPLQ